MITDAITLILASGSPRRAELIRKIDGLTVTVIPSRTREEQLPGEKPAAYAVRTAEEKAEEVFNRAGLNNDSGTVVLGCDTVVALGERIFGKPRDARQSEEFFRTLCGRTHTVITGVCCVRGGKDAKKITDFEKTRVTLGAFQPEIVYTYIQSGAPFDKAGGYGLQDAALKSLITKVQGDPDNVIGLPVSLVARILRENFQCR